MVWFFEREQEVTRLETPFDNDTQEYVLVFDLTNGARPTERFASLVAFRARLVELEHRLRAQNWVQRGDVQILDDGWQGPSTPRH